MNTIEIIKALDIVEISTKQEILNSLNNDQVLDLYLEVADLKSKYNLAYQRLYVELDKREQIIKQSKEKCQE